MRTRASGPSSPPSSPPPIQSAVRGRKRRSDGVDSGPSDAAPEQPGVESTTAGESHDQPEANERDGFLTPRKAKRVRFSEPAHNINSTGLTPSFRRTNLLADDPGSDALLRRKPSKLIAPRRVTLPARLDSDFTTSPLIQKIQYAPLRQVIDDRLRRRLRRNNLSEELNAVEDERREEQRERKELNKLRTQGQQSEAKIKDLMFEIESQRQLNIDIGTVEEQHAQALREELDRLRKDIANRDDEEEEEVRRRIEGSPTEFDSDEDLWDDQVPATSPLDAGFDTDTSSPALRGSSPPPPSSPLAHVGVQTSLNSELSYDAHDLSQQLAEAKRQASDARTALHLIHGELLALGFMEGTATSEQLVESIKDAFRQTRLDVEYLLPGETPGGFENVLLLPAMLDHVRKLLAKTTDTRRRAEVSAQSESAMRNQFNIVLEKAQHSENEKTILCGQYHNAVNEVQRKAQRIHDLELVANARAGSINERDQIIEKLESDLRSANQDTEAKVNRISELENDARDGVVSLERLQRALDSYRSEVSSLENVVSQLEKEKTGLGARVVSADDAAAAQRQRADQLTQTLTEVTGYVEHHLTQLKDDSEQHHSNHVKAFRDAKTFIEQQLSALQD